MRLTVYKLGFFSVKLHYATPMSFLFFFKSILYIYKDYHNFRSIPRVRKSMPSKYHLVHTGTITYTCSGQSRGRAVPPVVKSFHYRRSMTRGMRSYNVTRRNGSICTRRPCHRTGWIFLSPFHPWLGPTGTPCHSPVVVDQCLSLVHSLDICMITDCRSLLSVASIQRHNFRETVWLQYLTAVRNYLFRYLYRKFSRNGTNVVCADCSIGNRVHRV